MPTRAIFDCMLFIQAISNDRGAAGACFHLVEDRRVQLLMSPEIWHEVRDVLSRSAMARKFPVLNTSRPATFLKQIALLAETVPHVPKSFALPRDPDDEPYTDLAIAANADYLVTWNDRHLTYLMRRDTPEGIDFCARFPALKIVDPPTFLREAFAQS